MNDSNLAVTCVRIELQCSCGAMPEEVHVDSEFMDYEENIIVRQVSCQRCRTVWDIAIRIGALKQT